jgi:hypothetical protein
MPGAAAAAHGAARGDGSGSKSLPAKARSSYSAAGESQPEGSSAKTEPSASSAREAGTTQLPRKRSGVSCAQTRATESFQKWQDMLTASSSAKTEFESSAPHLSAMPPISMRIFEGPMAKKAISSSGVKWHGRYATLTDFHLSFAKQLDMDSTETMHWMHTKKLPTSVSELEEIFQRVDADGSGTLELEEAKACLIELHLFSNDQDVQTLFAALDVDRSGTLTLEEFLDLTKKAHAANYVVDYIPLVDITEVKAEIHRKAVIVHSDDDVRSEGPNIASVMPSDTDRKTPSFLNTYVKRLEVATGMDIDGDGKTDTGERVPEHDPRVSEVHIVIATIEGGHNSGKTYIHRVPESDAQAWLGAVTSAVKEAKAAALKKELVLKYGHSTYSMLRAKSQIAYQSERFQMLTASFILSAFALDICEAQLLPEQGSRTGFIFFLLDAIITLFFTLELMLNIFASRSLSRSLLQVSF